MARRSVRLTDAQCARIEPHLPPPGRSPPRSLQRRVMLDLCGHNGSASILRVLLGVVETSYCAKPDSLNYARLGNVIENRLRGMVLPARIAVGAYEGVARMARTKMSPVVATPAEGDDGGGEVRVRMLYNWISDLGVDPRAITFVESDTQGVEVGVLRGAQRLLAHRSARGRSRSLHNC